MSNIIKEVIAEYKLCIEDLEYEVKGRILKEIDGDGTSDYSFQVSHYYKPGETAATVHIPSTMTAKTEKEAKVLLFFYLKPFTGIGVEKNEKY